MLPPYAFGAYAIDHHPADIGLATGVLRGEAAGYATFFAESFIDELATKTGIDPLSFRIGLLGDAPRLAHCLSTAATLGGWEGGGAGSGQGLACFTGFGSFIAVMAEVHVGADGRIAVDRMSPRSIVAGDQSRAGPPADRGRAALRVAGCDRRSDRGDAAASSTSGGSVLSGSRRSPMCPIIADRVDHERCRPRAACPGSRCRRWRRRSPTRWPPRPAAGPAVAAEGFRMTDVLPADHPPVAAPHDRRAAGQSRHARRRRARRGAALSRRIPVRPARGRDPAAAVAADPARHHPAHAAQEIGACLCTGVDRGRIAARRDHSPRRR